MLNDIHAAKALRSRRNALPTITVEKPRCPRCNGLYLHKYRTIHDQGDGSSLWWVRCEDEACGHRFRVVLE